MNKIPSILWKRAAAFCIDFCHVAFLQFTVGLVVMHFYRFICRRYGVSPDGDVEDFLSEFLGAFFFVGYFTLSVGLFGNTVGKRLLNIKIIFEGTHRPPTLPQAYWRAMAYLMSSWTYAIGFILPWFRKDMKALHDLLCNTRVVSSIPIAERHELQLELPFLAPVHHLKIRTKSGDLEEARTGTGR
jgi:uncharacterized RDD family membrane protein YckC